MARLPALRSRRQAHSRCLHLTLPDGVPRPAGATDASAIAVTRHVEWVLELLAEIGGHRHRVEDRTAGMWGATSRGRLVVTTHHGNWIVGARALVERLGPVHTVAGVQLRGGWSDSVADHLARQGVHLTDVSGLRRTLRGGGTVVLHLDGQTGPHRRRSRPIGVVAAARLAVWERPEIFAARCVHAGPGSFVLEGVPLGLAQRGEEGDVSCTFSSWEDRFTRLLQDWVAGDPGGWMLFSPRHLAFAEADR
ncbi:MAG: hypothetical protein R3E12_03625 [Candidatus Eisenbacteria bacterium]